MVSSGDQPNNSKVPSLNTLHGLILLGNSPLASSICVPSETANVASGHKHPLAPLSGGAGSASEGQRLVNGGSAGSSCDHVIPFQPELCQVWEKIALGRHQPHSKWSWRLLVTECLEMENPQVSSSLYQNSFPIRSKHINLCKSWLKSLLSQAAPSVTCRASHLRKHCHEHQSVEMLVVHSKVRVCCLDLNSTQRTNHGNPIEHIALGCTWNFHNHHFGEPLMSQASLWQTPVVAASNLPE